MQDHLLFNALGDRRRVAVKFAIDLGLWLFATPLAFALLCNNFGTSSRRVVQAQDAIAELLASYRR